MSVTLRADGSIDGDYACPVFIQTICPDPTTGENGRFVVADSDIATIVSGTWQAGGSFELDAVNTAVPTMPFRGTFTSTGLRAVRDLGRREFVNCDLAITSTNTTTIDLPRDPG